MPPHRRDRETLRLEVEIALAFELELRLELRLEWWEAAASEVQRAQKEKAALRTTAVDHWQAPRCETREADEEEEMRAKARVRVKVKVMVREYEEA